MDRRAIPPPTALLFRTVSAARALALATVVASIPAACSIDAALQPGDLSSVGSITPPAPVGSAVAYNEPPNRETATRGAAAAFPADAVPDDSAGTTWQAPGRRGAAERLTLTADGGTATVEAVGNGVTAMDVEPLVEGNTRDPIVAGVGSGHPVAVEPGRPAPLMLPDGNGHETEIYTGPPGRGAPPRPLSLPKGAQGAQSEPSDAAPTDAGIKVAALLRPANPMREASDMQAGLVPRTIAPAPQSSRDSLEGTMGGMPASEVACRQELRHLGVAYTDIPRISKGPACGIAWPIKVTGLSGGIRIKPAATLNCQVTAEFAKWVKSDVAPAARARYFSGIRSITQLSSYSCRTMNSQPGAPMSEHAHGNAIDIGAITLNSGRKIDVRKPGWFAFRQRGFLNTVRAESCDNFTTVLGPGTNKYHWNHFHFDLRHRKSGRSYCE